MPVLGGNTPAGTLAGTEQIPLLNDTYTTPQNVANTFKGTAGTAIASAATIDLGAATGNTVHITGSTGPITSLGTVASGVERKVVFDSTPTLTHNATSLILPTGANITAAAGDSALFVSEGSGNWRCHRYNKADGTAIGGASIANDAVTNAKLANVNSLTFKGRLTASSGDPEDLTNAQARKVLNPVTALTNSAGTVTVDCSLGTTFTLTLAANVTTLTLSNLQGSGYATEIEIEIKQDATGSRTFALPAAFKALGGSDTAIASAANAVTVLSAKTFDNGTTWRYAMQESA